MTYRSRYEKWLAKIGLLGKKKNVNDVFNLKGLTEYWNNQLLEVCQQLFVWENLPFPQREIENLLMLRGYCSFVQSEKFKISEYAVTPCTYSGVTEYADIGTNCRWVTPIVSGNFSPLKNDKGVIIRNNSLTMSLMPLINRYAVLLANTDISLMCSLVNDRAQNILLADSQQTADGINQMFDALEDGKRKAVTNEKLFKSLEGCTSLPLANTKDTLRPICEVYDTVLQMFYNDIGVRYNREKKERVITSEVENDRQRLLINVGDMLTNRENACFEINKLYGLNISVKLSADINNPQVGDFSQLKKDNESEVEENDDIERISE